MMTGQVDAFRRPLLPISLRADSAASPVKVEAWIDTGFTGDLVLPQSLVTALQLLIVSRVDVGLADGSEAVLDTFAAYVDWFGELRRIEVIANTGQYPLLGAGLLAGHRLLIDYNACSLEIE